MLTYKSNITLLEYLDQLSELGQNFKDGTTEFLYLSTMNETFPISVRMGEDHLITNRAFLINILHKRGYHNILSAPVESVLPVEAFFPNDIEHKYKIDNTTVVVKNDGFAYFKKFKPDGDITFIKLNTIYEIRLKKNIFEELRDDHPCLFSKIKVYEFAKYIRELHREDCKFVIINAQDCAAPIHMLESISSVEERFESDHNRYLFNIIESLNAENSDDPLYFIYY